MKGSILVVEDDKFSQRMMQQALDSKGFITYTADNGMEGIAALEANPLIKVCLLDLNMSILDGYGFLKHINNLPEYKFLNVYITSCNDREHFSEIAKQENISLDLIKGYYEKPFDFFKLIEGIGDTK